LEAMGANYFLKFNLGNLRIFKSVTIMIYRKLWYRKLGCKHLSKGRWDNL
jgi:hypothetical protein